MSVRSNRLIALAGEDLKSEPKVSMSLDLPATKENCQGDLACRKLLADSAASVFLVRGDHETGTGWIGPDGRLVTDYHVLMGNREITAEDDKGHIYRLGTNVSIDDVNDLAALGFVDGAPKDAVPLKLDTTTPQAGDSATLLSHRNGNALEMSTGSFVGPQVMADKYADKEHRQFLDQSVAKWRLSSDVFHRESATYLSRQLYDFKIGGNHGSSGGPIFDKDGGVSSVLEMQGNVPGTVWAIPASSVQSLLAQSDGQRKFRVTSGYETGLSNYFHRLGQESFLHSTIDAGLPAVGALSLTKFAIGSAGRLATVLGGAVLADTTFDDAKALYGSTNWRDAAANGIATIGDALMIGGFISRYLPTARSASLALLGAGAAVRVGAELIPNHYTLQKIDRSDGSPEKPFLDMMVHMGS